MKILVADDSRVMRQIVIRTLRQAGYDDHDIVEAEDGRDALDKVATESPDLVLSDWNMPNMSGIECLEVLRSSGSVVPFGFVTSEGSAEMREKARIYGESYPVDEDFLTALSHMPEASGIALGLDRLVMLATGADHIERVLWTPVTEAGA